MAWFMFMTLAALLVFIILLFSTCIPYTCLRNCCVSTSKFTISLLGCGSCGVFIATCFLGLVPHVRHQEMILRSNETVLNTYNFLPSTDQLVIFGFIIILILEQIIHGVSHSIGNAHSSLSSLASNHNIIKMRKFMKEEEGDDIEPLVDVECEIGDDDEEHDEIIFRKTSNSPTKGNGHSYEDDHLHNSSETMSVRVWFLLLGMSVHSFFEGVALGVQNDIKAFYQILVAVLFHEVLCCVSYGVQLAKHNAGKKYAWTSSLFLSATIPLGMIIATSVDGIENEMWQKVGRYWLEGLAAGTFVHVALVELLPMELHSEGGTHSHSHNIINETNHTSTFSNWAPLVKSLFVAAGIGSFVILKGIIGQH